MFARKSALVRSLCELIGSSLLSTSDPTKTTDHSSVINKILRTVLCGCVDDDSQKATFVSSVKKILRQLNCNQLNLLMKIIRDQSVSTDCVVLDLKKFRRNSCSSRASPNSLEHWMYQAPHLVLGFAYRWHCEDKLTLQSAASKIRSLPFCRHDSSPDAVCVNPFHWTLMDQFQDTVNEYVFLERITEPSCSDALLDSSSTEVYCETTSTTDSCFNLWSNLNDTPQFTVIKSTESRHSSLKAIYFETNQIRQTATFNVGQNNSFEIFHKSPNMKLESSQRMNLQKCTDSNVNIFSSRVRSRIGFGVVLMVDERKDIWLYNRSNISVFVKSLTAKFSHCDDLSKIEPSNNAPFKIQPGHIARVFDQQMFHRLLVAASSEPSTLSPNCLKHFRATLRDISIQISFVKGFGTGYCFRECIECPSWLLVNLNDFITSPIYSS